MLDSAIARVLTISTLLTMSRCCHRAIVAVCAVLSPVCAQAPPEPPAAPARFANGLPTTPEFFPMGVWLQSPHNASRYRELGINLYVGLHNGPTPEQLTMLEAAGMRVLCAQNAVGLAHRGNAIVGWMHDDEPDNARGRKWSGQLPPRRPWEIVADYERMHRADPSRPILLNLGQGAAWDGWHGRGDRNQHPEDYPEYVKGGDLVSFDIYPVTHTHREVRGRLEFVGRGVQRLRQWTRDQKPVWACIETSHVDNPDVRPTAEQVRTEAWLAIANGASGIVWFVHEFAPQFVEAGLLQYPDIVAAVRATNAELVANAAILNSPRADALLAVEPAAGSAAVAARTHLHAGELHVFLASMQPEPLTATLRPHGGPWRQVQVDDAVGEPLSDARWRAELPGYAVRHLRFKR
jgi:hypothetical protein